MSKAKRPPIGVSNRIDGCRAISGEPIQDSRREDAEASCARACLHRKLEEPQLRYRAD
jgi:hypothetical protein